MTYEQYWYGDPLMVRAFYKAEKLRQQRKNEEAWLQGIYTFQALNATVGNMMREKGTQPIKYPEKPFDLEPPKVEPEDEVLFAKAYMENMVLMGKNWGKKGGSGK